MSSKDTNSKKENQLDSKFTMNKPSTAQATVRPTTNLDTKS